MVRILLCYRFIIRSLEQAWCSIIPPCSKLDTADPYHPAISTPEMQLLLFFRISPEQWEQTIISHKSTVGYVPSVLMSWLLMRQVQLNAEQSKWRVLLGWFPGIYFSSNLHFNLSPAFVLFIFVISIFTFNSVYTWKYACTASLLKPPFIPAREQKQV